MNPKYIEDTGEIPPQLAVPPASPSIGSGNDTIKYSGGGGGGGGGGQTADAGSIAQKKLAEISRDELKNYLAKFGDMEESLAGDTNSTALIDSAKESQVLGQQVSQESQSRTLSRYGASMTPAQMAAQQRIGSLGNASSYAGAVNNSALDQRDRNQSLRNSLLGIGNEQLGVAMSGLGAAAGMEAGREAEYQRAKAAAHASNMQMIGQIIGFGIG